MRLTTLCLTLLSCGLAAADQPQPFTPPRWQRQGSTLRLNCPLKPSSVYFRSKPDRLVVEFAGVQMQGGSPGGATGPGVTAVHWRQPDISHVTCEVGLAYPLPAQQLRWQGDSVEVDLEYQWEERFRLSPAVVWNRREQARDGRYLLWNELSVDPSDPNVSLQIGLAKERTDSRERTTDMVKRSGAVAGINGGYFANSGGPLGVVYKNGKLVSPHVGRRPPRTVLGVMKDRKVAMDQVIAQKGTLASRSGQAWNDVELALGGGPRLLRRSKLALTTNEEELGPNGNDITRLCARTAVATTRDGRILLLTASGPQDNHLQGVRLEELAGELLRRGGEEAMNLDGGGSTAMAIGERLVSLGPTASSFERPVATALLVHDSRAESRTQPHSLELRCSDKEALADGTTRVDLEATVRDAAGRPVADGTPVRFFVERMRLSKKEFVTKDGAVALQAVPVTSTGLAAVQAQCAGARDRVEMRLVSGEARKLWTVMQPVAGRPGKFLLTVQAVDQWQNGVKGAVILCGEARQVSGANGQTSFEVAKAPGSAASTLTVACDNGPSATVELPAVPMPPSPSSSPAASPSGSPSPGAPASPGETATPPRRSRL
jgi:exopolysaccharide biosynthesis protein